MNRATIITTNIQLPIREETLDGTRYVVAPVVMIVEGVHAGNQGPTYYPASELATFPESWNGRPVTVDHPQQSGEFVSANAPSVVEQFIVGSVYNTQFDGHALRAEIWVDVVKAESVAPQILIMLKRGERLEVSTGLFTEDDGQSGTWNGEQFESTARHHRPDHLALLATQEGACSWRDGCGVRANKKKGTDVITKSDRALRWLQLHTLEQSHEDVRHELQKTVDALDNPSWIHFVVAVFEDSFVYSAVTSNPSEGAQSQTILYKAGYTVTENGTVTLADEREEVREERNFVPVTNAGEPVAVNCQCGKPRQEATHMEAVKEKVTALIACNRTQYTEDHREWMETLSEDQLTLMEVPEPETVVTNVTVNAPVGDEPTNAEPVTEPGEEAPAVETEPENKVQTMEEFIASTPEAFREPLQRMYELDQAHKAQLVGALVANKANKFTEDELNAMTIKALENVAALAKKNDYSGQNPAEVVTNEETPAPNEPSLVWPDIGKVAATN